MESRDRFKESILADLPTNGSEPDGLRESIADELSDHLQCSMRRELLNGGGHADAKGRVMQRFGNVGSVARQLWFDAMRQRLLTQRFLLAAAGLLTAACVLIGTIAWITVTNLRGAFEAEAVARKSAAAKLIQAEEENRRLLEQLANISGPGVPPATTAPKPQTRRSLSQTRIQNGNMEETTEDGVVAWGTVADRTNPFEGEVSARFQSDDSKPAAGMTRSVVQWLDATAYRGKRIRYRAAVRTESTTGGQAQLWCRVDRKPAANGQTELGGFDNMSDRPIRSPDWKHHEIVLDVADDATVIAAGMFIIGHKTTAWLDDVSLEVVADDIEVTDNRASGRRPASSSGQNAAVQFPAELRNGTMEETNGVRTVAWNCQADRTKPFEGDVAGLLESDDTKPAAGMTATANQILDATPFQGKRIRFRAAVRVESESEGRAQLWCRVDGKSESSGRSKTRAFDNMQDRPITGTEWRHYEIVVDVARDAEKIIAGILVIGHKTKVWFDDASLEVVDRSEVATTGAAPATAATQPFFNNWLWLAVVTLVLMVWSQRTKRDDEGVAVDPGFTTKFALRFSVAYWLLYSFPQPFTSFLPGMTSFNAWYTSGVDSVVRWTAAEVLNIKRTLTAPNGSGDTTFAYVRLLIGFVLALGIAGVWSGTDWRKTSYAWTKDLLRSYLRYVLAFTMLGYGIAKAGNVMNQFPAPGEYHLTRTYGDSSPMGLLWTFMGASRPYTIFSGLVECLCAVLLVWRRTTVVGSMVTFSLMLNVVLLNFCYDVPVKLFSVHLLVMAIYVALPDLRRLFGVLFLNRATEPVDERPPYAPGNLIWIARVIKALVIVVGVAMPIYQKVQAERAYAVQVASEPEFVGSRFDVDSVTVENGGATGPDITAIEFIARPYTPEGRPGRTTYLRIEGARGRSEVPVTFEDNTIQPGSDESVLGTGSLSATLDDSDHLELVQSGENPITIKLTRAEGPLLMTRGFRWVNEVPFNR